MKVENIHLMVLNFRLFLSCVLDAHMLGGLLWISISTLRQIIATYFNAYYCLSLLQYMNRDFIMCIAEIHCPVLDDVPDAEHSGKQTTVGSKHVFTCADQLRNWDGYVVTEMTCLNTGEWDKATVVCAGEYHLYSTDLFQDEDIVLWLKQCKQEHSESLFIPFIPFIPL